MDENPILYEIVAYDNGTKQVTAQRIYDQNAILLENEDDRNNRYLSVEELLDQMYIMESEEEEGVRQEMKNERHTITIKYQVEGFDNFLECVPLSVEPSYVSLNEYQINFNPSQRCIGKVTNNKYGSVKFKSIEMDANHGYVSTSPLDVWTTVLSDGLVNIFHCHLVDRNDSVPIATVYMKPNKTVQDYHDFDKDSAGQLLRYKILVQGDSIHTILYNTGVTIEELQFKEIRVEPNALMQAIIPEQYDDQPIIVRVAKIPVCMICADNESKLKNIEEEKAECYSLSECKMRHFERLSGQVDVQLISEDNCSSLYEGEHMFSIPICACQPLDQFQTTLITSLKEAQDKKAAESVSDLVDKLKVYVSEMERKVYKDGTELRKEFTQLKAAVEELGDFLEGDIDDEDLQEEAQQIAAQANKVVRRLAAEMRVLPAK